MDSILEQKLAILSQAVLIWLVSFICYLFFFSVSWGYPALYATLSVLIIALITSFMVWLNVSIERTSNLGMVIQAAFAWILICIIIDIAAHLQIGLIDFEIMTYMLARGWQFLVILPTAIAAWLIYLWSSNDSSVPHATRFSGRRR